MKEILITSSVLIVVLLLLRVIFAQKVSRVLIYGAWGLVALRLLVPVQIGEIDFSILTSAKPMTEAITEVSNKQVAGVTEQDAYREIIKDYVEKDQTVFTPEVQEHIQSALRDEMPKEEIAVMIDKVYAEQEVFVPEVQEQVQQQVEETAEPITLGQIATIVWLAGVAVMAAWFMIVNLRHSRMLRKNREKLDCESPIPVYVSEKVGSPCLVGLFRPAIYLTPESAEDPTVLRHVLTHERTHYAHKDHIWSVVRCVCLCAYWFDPLVWVAAWFSRRDCELACDEGALKRLDEGERIAYGKSLLDVVSHASTPANLMQTATSMNETKKQLRERVNFIVKKQKISIIAAVCMVIVCAIVAGCAAAGPMNSEPQATTPTGTIESTVPGETTQPTVLDDGVRTVQLLTKGGWPIKDTYIYVYADEALTQKLETIRTDETGFATYAGEAGATYYMVVNNYYLKVEGYVPAPYYIVNNTQTELLVDTELKGSLWKELGEVMCEIDFDDWKGNQFQLSKVIGQGKPCLIWCVDDGISEEKMTVMLQIYEEYGDKLEILLYATQETRYYIKKLAEKMEITFPVIIGGQYDPEWVYHRGIMVVDRYGMLALRDFESKIKWDTMKLIAVHFTDACYRQDRVFERCEELMELVGHIYS